MNRILPHTAFSLGLAAIGWVAAGYLGSNPVALAMTVLIGAFYLMGALELHRFQQATATLARAVAGMPSTVDTLDPWLEQLHPSLRHPVRTRIEGGHGTLPGPVMVPYLAGLLVLLGMLGTFLGMVVTLHGTGIAIESAADLKAIRASLAAPVKGLGLAFGTSLAGVAASAMLGLMSAWRRRERLLATQQLDAKIATTLRVFSRAHQRDESFGLMQRQAELMPRLVDRLEALMARMEQQGQQTQAQLLAQQESFYGKAEAAYAGLAASVDQSLKSSLAEGARAAGAAIQPVVEATMAGLAREAAALNGSIAGAVQQQLDSVSTRLDATAHTLSEAWSHAIDRQERSSEALLAELRETLDRFAAGFEQRSVSLVDTMAASQAEWRSDIAGTVAGLARDTGALHERIAGTVSTQLDGVTARLDSAVGTMSQAWDAALARQEHSSTTLSLQTQQALSGATEAFGRQAAAQERSSEALMAGLRDTLDRFAASFEQRSVSLVDGIASSQAAWRSDIAGTLSTLARDTGALHERMAGTVTTQLDGVAARLDSAVGTMSHAWDIALAQQERSSTTLSQQTQQALSGATEAFSQQAADLLQQVGQAHAALQAGLASRDEQRLAALSGSLQAMGTHLQHEWQQAGAQALAQQRQICATLEQTARAMAEQSEAHARNTIGEIGRLVQAAAEAPRAAAELVGELRRSLSESMARDNQILQERSRIMETLRTLLDAVNQASGQQREAIDALVASSAAMLQDAGARFEQQLGHGTGQMETAAAQVAGGAAEVASLGEAMGFAVQLFSEANDKLVGHLQRIEAALSKSITRSDEQLAYYVAQARELIDLSILSQQQIVEDLKQAAGTRAPEGAEA